MFVPNCSRYLIIEMKKKVFDLILLFVFVGVFLNLHVAHLVSNEVSPYTNIPNTLLVSFESCVGSQGRIKDFWKGGS